MSGEMLYRAMSLRFYSQTYTGGVMCKVARELAALVAEPGYPDALSIDLLVERAPHAAMVARKTWKAEMTVEQLESCLGRVGSSRKDYPNQVRAFSQRSECNQCRHDPNVCDGEYAQSRNTSDAVSACEPGDEPSRMEECYGRLESTYSGGNDSSFGRGCEVECSGECRSCRHQRIASLGGYVGAEQYYCGLQPHYRGMDGNFYMRPGIHRCGCR